MVGGWNRVVNWVIKVKIFGCVGEGKGSEGQTRMWKNSLEPSV